MEFKVAMTIQAEAWAFQFSANSLRDKMEFNGEDLSSVAYNVFDERIDDRGEIGSRLYLSSPNDETPAVFVEKDGERFDIVFTWNGEEKYRDDLGRIFYDDARRYLS